MPTFQNDTRSQDAALEPRASFIAALGGDRLSPPPRLVGGQQA